MIMVLAGFSEKFWDRPINILGPNRPTSGKVVYEKIYQFFWWKLLSTDKAEAIHKAQYLVEKSSTSFESNATKQKLFWPNADNFWHAS